MLYGALSDPRAETVGYSHRTIPPPFLNLIGLIHHLQAKFFIVRRSSHARILSPNSSAWPFHQIPSFIRIRIRIPFSFLSSLSFALVSVARTRCYHAANFRLIKYPVYPSMAAPGA